MENDTLKMKMPLLSSQDPSSSSSEQLPSPPHTAQYNSPKIPPFSSQITDIEEIHSDDPLFSSENTHVRNPPVVHLIDDEPEVDNRRFTMIPHFPHFSRVNAAAAALSPQFTEEHKLVLRKYEEVGNYSSGIKYYYQITKKSLPTRPTLHPRRKLCLSKEQIRDLFEVVMMHVEGGETRRITPLPTLDGMNLLPLAYPSVEAAFHYQLSENSCGCLWPMLGSSAVGLLLWFGYAIIPKFIPNRD